MRHRIECMSSNDERLAVVYSNNFFLLPVMSLSDFYGSWSIVSVLIGCADSAPGEFPLLLNPS